MLWTNLINYYNNLQQYLKLATSAISRKPKHILKKDNQQFQQQNQQTNSMESIIKDQKHKQLEAVFSSLLAFSLVQLLMIIGLYFFTLPYMLLIFVQTIRISSVLSTLSILQMENDSTQSLEDQSLREDEDIQVEEEHLNEINEQEGEFQESGISSQSREEHDAQEEGDSLSENQFLFRLNIAFLYYISPKNFKIIKYVFLVLLGLFSLYHCVSWKVYKIIITAALNILTLMGAYSPIQVLFYEYCPIKRRVYTFLTIITVVFLYYSTGHWLFNNIYAIFIVLSISNFSSSLYTNQLLTVVLHVLIYYFISLFLDNMVDNWVTKLHFPWKFIFLYSVGGIIKKTSLSVLFVAYVAVLEKTVRECKIILLQEEDPEKWSECLRKFLVPFFVISYFFRYYVFFDHRTFIFIILPVGILWVLKKTIFSERFDEILDNDGEEEGEEDLE